MPDLDELLARVGLAARPPASVEGLRTLHRAYVSRVPYETLAIHLGEYEPLDLDRLAHRFTTGGRGGYCFEVNAVLGWMLEELGFGVTRLEARVGARDAEGPTNHLVLVAAVPGREERWFADAGLGEGWLDPLPQRPGVHAGPGGLAWTVERAAGSWWITQHPWASVAGLEVRQEPVALDAFAPHHERLSTHPESSFMGALVLQAVADDRITTLRARTFTERGPLVETREVLSGQDAFERTLAERFGVDTAALGPERTRCLWAAAMAQHDTWLATRRPAGTPAAEPGPGVTAGDQPQHRPAAGATLPGRFA